jgi:hypothetical protein
MNLLPTGYRCIKASPAGGGVDGLNTSSFGPFGTDRAQADDFIAPHLTGLDEMNDSGTLGTVTSAGSW